MTRIKTTFTMLTMIAVSVLAAQAQADEYLHINNLAQRIQNKSSELHRQMKHYRYTPHYEHVRRDALDMKRLARDIRRLAEREGSIVTLAACLDELGALYQHTAELVDEIDFSLADGVGYVQGGTCLVQDLMVDLEDCIYKMKEDVAIIRARTIRNLSRRTYYTPAVREVYVPRRPVYVPQKPVYVPPATRYVPNRQTYVPPGFTRCPNTGRLIASSRPPKKVKAQKYGNGRGYNNNRGGITVGKGNFRVHFNF